MDGCFGRWVEVGSGWMLVGGWWLCGCVGGLFVAGRICGWICRYVGGGWVDVWMDVSLGGWC